MKYLVSALSVALLALGVAGCSQKAAVLPTDERSKEIAAQAPPPIIGMGGPSTPSKNTTNAQGAATHPTPGKNKLRGAQH